MGIALILQALFIPYIFLICAPAAGLAWLGGRTGKTGFPPFPTPPWSTSSSWAGAALVMVMNLPYTADGSDPW